MALQLSIAVPSYNVEDYLPHDLETYCDERLKGLVEVIIVNDGSTDATHDIAASYVRRMPEVFRLVDKDNGGHGSAVNAGLAAARGRYFRVIDADDWTTTDDLVKLAHRLEHIETDLVVDVKREVDMATHGEKLFPLPEDLPLDTPLPIGQALERPDFESLAMIHTLSLRRAFCQEIGLRLLEHTFYVDFEYVVKATLPARDITFENLNVYNYLVGNASQSVADASYVKRFADHTRVTQAICQLWRTQEASLDSLHRSYLLRRATLISNTHYNIALIFDKDRKRGRARAKAFHEELHERYPEVAAATERRYRQDLLLHALGVDSQAKLDRFTGRTVAGRQQ